MSPSGTTEKQTRLGYLVRIVFVTALMSLWASVSLAQEPTGEPEPVEMSDEQIALNNKAIRAIKKDPKAAIQYSKAALLVGEPNSLLHMTLGRAYQLEGDCQKAKAAFDDALTANFYRGVPPEKILARVEKYRGDMAQLCPGRVRVVCEPDGIDLYVADQNFACGEEISLEPGKYMLEGTLDGQTKRMSVEVEATEVTEKTLVMVSKSEQLAEAVAVAQREASTAVRLGSLQSIAVARARESERLQREQREREEREAASAEANVPPAPTSDAVAKSSAEAPVGPRKGGFAELVIGVPVGSSAVQIYNGAVDAGFAVGGVIEGAGGWAFTEIFGVEQVLNVGYQHGFSSGIKSYGDNQDLLAIETDRWRVRSDTRAWLSVMALGFTADYNNLQVIFPDDRVATEMFLAGPSITFSTRGQMRTESQWMFSGRYLPINANGAVAYEFETRVEGELMSLALSYGQIDSRDTPSGDLRRSESLMMTVGARFPFTF